MAEEDLEKDLILIGVSGLADKLQEDVKECISDFIDAGMKVWIVTGDKDSTAYSIGHDCGILSEQRETLRLGMTNESDDAQKLMDQIINESSENKDLMISGTTLSQLIETVESVKDLNKRQKLIDSFMKPKGFVVYRSSPKQKAALVSFIRTNCKNKTTLAIGDGANDVNMI